MTRWTMPLLRVVHDTLGDLHHEGREFWETLGAVAPRNGDAKLLASRLGVVNSTLNSRFVRAEIPTPKRLLVAWRICLAAGLFDERDRPIADVAYTLEYASPQSFTRHLKQWRGVAAGEFRATHPFNGELAWFRRQIQSTAYRWRDFRPITGRQCTLTA